MDAVTERMALWFMNEEDLYSLARIARNGEELSEFFQEWQEQYGGIGEVLADILSMINWDQIIEAVRS